MEGENYRYQFIAGNLALDFINTVAYRFDPQKVRDHLQSSKDILQWINQAPWPDRDAVKPSAHFGHREVLRVRAVRDQLFAIFHAIASDKPIPAGALGQISKALHECRAQQFLSVEQEEVLWRWRPGARCSDVLLCPILIAATDLLTSEARSLVRRCADEGCGWLFLDRSNARKRRWCSMADCGNRNKVREHYKRKAGPVGRPE